MPIYIDPKSIAKLKASAQILGKGAAPAMRIALNKGVDSAKTRGSRWIRDRIRLPAPYVSSRITKHKASNSNLVGYIQTPLRGTLMSYYLVRSRTQALARYSKSIGSMIVSTDTSAEIKTLIKPGGPVITWNHAFLMTNLKNSGITAVAGRPDGKLKVFYGPSLSQVLNTVKDELTEDELQPIVLKEMDRQVKRLLGDAF